MKRLTPLQKDVLCFCKLFLKAQDQFPTTRNLQEEYGWSSQTSAISVLRALEKKGFLERNLNNHYRFKR